jgi:hypothetical protein
LATSKEIPDDILDAKVKGLFWLLEAWRQNPIAQGFLLNGGDASVSRFFHDPGEPTTKASLRRAYPGSSAPSKVRKAESQALYPCVIQSSIAAASGQRIGRMFETKATSPPAARNRVGTPSRLDRAASARRASSLPERASPPTAVT